MEFSSILTYLLGFVGLKTMRINFSAGEKK